jgi:TolA-binding protein
MQKNYKQALQMYNSIIAANSKSSDYAQYQKAIISGAAGKQNDKINQLQELIRLYPSSNLIAAANIEIANAYLADENYAQAISPLQQIIKDRNASALYPKAYLKLGVANFNLDKNTEALNNFTKLVVTYPNSSESDEAIEYIRNIFIEQQQPNAFIKFMNDNGKPISYAEGDSLTFRAAQLKFDAKDFKSALMGFENYRNSYPEGKHIVEANYLAAEMYSTNKDVVKALPLYLNVMAKAPNKFAEKSALQVARIYYFENKDFNNAATYYQQLKLIATQQENRLEAMRGLLRCQYKTQQWKAAVNNAQDLLQEKTVATDDKMMANLIIAKSYQLNNELDAAINAYKQVTVTGKSEFSAEAQYSIAEILLQQNKLTEAEKAGFETIKKYGSYENWVTKSYILLGDVYYAQKDWFNAEATFKSVADNATDSNLKNEAKEKLAKVLAEKNKIDKVD